MASDDDWKLLAAGAAGFLFAWLAKPAPSAADRLRKEGVPFLASLVKQWRPTACETEREYQESLHQYLLGQFSEDVLVQKEYGTEKRQIDIVVDQRYGVEMKADISSGGRMDRVDDQVDAVKKHLSGGLLVLCGSVTEEARRRLRRKFREEDQATQSLEFDVVVATSSDAG